MKSSGIGFSGLLTLVFITLKLCGTIPWSWLWVLSPLWIPLAVLAGIFVGACFVALIAGLLMGPGDKRNLAYAF